MSEPQPKAQSEPESLRLHASCVAFARSAEAARSSGDGGEDWAGVLIRAPSGGGKSAFALRLIALGARLVADDQTLLCRDGDGRLLARAPASLSGVIEARGVGLLQLPPLADAPIAWVVDLKIGGAEGRLPRRRNALLLGGRVPALTLPEDEKAASALCCLVRDGALLDPEADLADFKNRRVGQNRAKE